jgi:hypothetical protein
MLDRHCEARRANAGSRAEAISCITDDEGLAMQEIASSPRAPASAAPRNDVC